VNIGIAVDDEHRAVVIGPEEFVEGEGPTHLDEGFRVGFGVESDGVAEDVVHAVEELARVFRAEGGAADRPADDDRGIGDTAQPGGGGEVSAEAETEVA
jgi:hypothetical protein